MWQELVTNDCTAALHVFSAITESIYSVVTNEADAKYFQYFRWRVHWNFGALKSIFTQWMDSLKMQTQYSISSGGSLRPYSIWRIQIRIQTQIFQIQWIHPFSVRIRIRIREQIGIRIRESSEPSFDMDSLAKPEVTSVSQMQTTNNDITSDNNNESRPFELPANPNPYSLWIWIQIRQIIRFAKSETMSTDWNYEKTFFSE